MIGYVTIYSIYMLYMVVATLKLALAVGQGDNRDRQKCKGKKVYSVASRLQFPNWTTRQIQCCVDKQCLCMLLPLTLLSIECFRRNRRTIKQLASHGITIYRTHVSAAFSSELTFFFQQATTTRSCMGSTCMFMSNIQHHRNQHPFQMTRVPYKSRLTMEPFKMSCHYFTFFFLNKSIRQL